MLTEVFIPQDRRLLFRLQKQHFIELLRQGKHREAIGVGGDTAVTGLDAMPTSVHHTHDV